MGYAKEYHVERYLRECFVPRIAPVSRVSKLGSRLTQKSRDATNRGIPRLGDDPELCQ